MELIYLIIVFVAVSSMIRKSKGKQGNRKGEPGGGSSRPPVRTAGSQTRRTAEKTVPKAAPQKPADALPQGSTMAYLHRKAQEDQREHAKDAYQEEMRLARETGGRKAALRHYEGDSVPKGMRLVACGYCGAENLIPEREKQSSYTCYFCREVL